jgi:hypothetical protein
MATQFFIKSLIQQVNLIGDNHAHKKPPLAGGFLGLVDGIS